MSTILTAAEKLDYRHEHHQCEVWPLMPECVRDDVCDLPSTIRLRYEKNLSASDLAHICRGPGRVDYAANVLCLSRVCHCWVDNHGAAGQVLLFAAKWLSGGADWELWGRLFTGEKSIRGWLTTDKVIEQCDEWDLRPLVMGMICDERCK